MIKTQKNSSSALKVTASLLNSWNYLFYVDPQYYQKSYQDFVNTLHKIKTPQTPAMLNGINFEQDCYDGKVRFISPLIENGAFQVFAKKELEVDDETVLVLGYLDVLKEGVIYDIKRTSSYEMQKYYNSFQHHVYFFLIDEAEIFEYLIAAGYKDYDIFIERYHKTDMIAMKDIVQSFFKWLKANDLWNVYVENFTVEKIKKGELL
jgi:hypothetical protein